MSLQVWFIPVVFLFFTLSGCSDHDDGENIPPPAELYRIQLEVDRGEMPVGITQTVTATGYYTDDTTESGIDYTWSSEFETIATVDTKGNVTGVGFGLAKIKASESGIENIIYIQINEALVQSIDITPGLSSVAGGLTVQYQANALYSDGLIHDVTSDDYITWDTADHSIAYFQANDGLVYTTDFNPDTEVTIDVSFHGLTATSPATLQVTDAKLIDFVITPDTTTTVPNGQQILMIATAYYDNDTTWQASSSSEWSSEDDDIITHGEHSGYFIGKSVGKTVIHASFEDLSDSIAVEVVHAEFDSLQIHSSEASYPVGIYEQFTATADFIGIDNFDITNEKNTFWTSSNPAVATVSTTGEVHMISADSEPVIISVNFQGIIQTKSITVTTPELSRIEIYPNTNYVVAENYSRKLQVIGHYDNGTIRYISRNKDLVWSFDNYATDSINEGTVNQEGEVFNYPTDNPITIYYSLKVDLGSLSATSLPYFGATNVLSNNDRNLNFIGPFTDLDIEGLFEVAYEFNDIFVEDGTTGPEDSAYISLQFEEAVSLCDTLRYNNHDDYRLPTSAELQSIWTKYNASAGAGENKLYTEQKWAIGQNYWTSDIEDDGNHNVVNLRNGDVLSVDASTTSHYVSCVRPAL